MAHEGISAWPVELIPDVDLLYKRVHRNFSSPTAAS